ncbi:MAG: hemolysin III family protein [Candidatus Heimdallarchaeota archaeon]|nr:hemolysin III family protein [Candidatus Heimdallarchaeota archaeon]MCK4770709.1 hemolysin III family protein [Candidatus Heimdallarchaeota archaeon]
MNLRKPIPTERFATYSHYVGLVFAIIGSIYLIYITRKDNALLAVSITYSFCICFMFTGSSVFHTLKKEGDGTSFWRQLDHIAIYFMIAGSYTIVSYLYLSGNFRWIIISLQWGFVAFGTILKILAVNVPTWLDVGIYLAMGWMIAIRIDYMFKEFPLRVFLLVLFGGLAYTIGAIFHAINKQKPFPGVFVFHDIFHVLIIVGASLHYVTIIDAVI